MKTSLPICSLIYITDQVEDLRVWCRQWCYCRKGPTSRDAVLGDVVVFRRLLKTVALILIDRFLDWLAVSQLYE